MIIIILLSVAYRYIPRTGARGDRPKRRTRIIPRYIFIILLLYNLCARTRRSVRSTRLRTSRPRWRLRTRQNTRATRRRRQSRALHADSTPLPARQAIVEEPSVPTAHPAGWWAEPVTRRAAVKVSSQRGPCSDLSSSRHRDELRQSRDRSFYPRGRGEKRDPSR